MILRKPYAFLIRFFKLIHIVLFMMSVYMCYQLRSIYIFFKEFVKTDVYLYIENIADYYIPLLLFILTFITIVMVIAIFYLMRQKEKPVLFYRIYTIYSVLLLFILIVYRNFFSSLELESYNRLALSIYRDIIGVMYYGTYFFIVYDFVRGFGFDIKKFSFDKDLKDLDITETDNEEFELAISLDKEKIREKIRRERRYAKYYLKENAVTLIIIGVLLIGLGGFFLYSEIYKKNVVYNQSDIVTANDFTFKINSAYVTNYNKYNQAISDNYLVVNFNVQNNGESNRIINLDRTRLFINDKYYYPILNKYDYFNDLASGYNKQKLKSGVTSSYILVFKVDSLYVNQVLLELFDSQEDVDDTVKVNYVRMNLDLIDVSTTKIMNTFNTSDIIKIENKLLKGSFTISDYEIDNRFTVEYEKCSLGTCNKYKNNIWSPSNDVLKIDIDNVNFPIKSLENYLSIEYLTNDIYTVNEYETKILYVDNNSFYVEVPKDLNNAKTIILNINIHNYIYRIVLKGESNNAN